MSRPTHRIVLKRKDGAEITFVDYRGETQTKLYQKVGSLFTSRSGVGFDIALDGKVTLDPDVFWINVYPVDEEEARPRGAANRVGPRKGRKAEPEGDDPF